MGVVVNPCGIRTYGKLPDYLENTCEMPLQLKPLPVRLRVSVRKTDAGKDRQRNMRHLKPPAQVGTAL